VQASRVDTGRYRALLDVLLGHWSDKPPQRRSRRERKAATIIVTHGLNRVYRMLACGKFAKEGKQLNYVEHMRHGATVFRGEFGSVVAGNTGTTTEQSLTPLEILKKLELARNAHDTRALYRHRSGGKRLARWPYTTGVRQRTDR